MAPSFSSPTTLTTTLDVCFDRATLCLDDESSKEGVYSLSDLIQFNADHNPDHLFAIQEVKFGQHRQLERVTFLSLHHAVLACREWLSVNFAAQRHKKPIGLLMESDLGLFIYLASLLSLESPVLLLSARLGPAAISHLVAKTGTVTILTSKRTVSVASHATLDSPIQIINAPPFSEFLTSPSIKYAGQRLPRVPSHKDEPGTLILHSSGTTGLPKPVFLTHRYVLGYAACHRLRPEESVGRVNVSTLPLYHGFGLLAPCLSLSVGKPCCFPSPSIIPSATSTIELLQSTNALSLMTVPSIIEEIASFSGPSSLETLRSLDFVAVGGGAIKPEIGEKLHSQGVTLLNHYGATEIGAIAHIFVPDATYDWHYLRLRSDLGLQVKSLESDNSLHCKLLGYPFGWDRAFEVQDLLERNPASIDDVEVKILSRKDDVIVLATGEKVLPHLLEETLNGKTGIKTAVVFGERRETVGVLIESQQPIAPAEYQGFINKVWKWIDEVNHLVDRHARVPSQGAVVVVPEGKSIPRSDKGSVMRHELSRVFADEIERAYLSLSKNEIYLNPANALPGLRALVQASLGDRIKTTLADESDFFELGMDSLEATRLSRQLNSLPNRDSFQGLTEEVRPDFIYQHPTLSSLAGAMTGEPAPQPRSQRASEMQDTLRKALQCIGRAGSEVVLLTGSTGTLGVHMLEILCRNPHVKSIICINRSQPGVDAWIRQEESCRAKGIQLPLSCRDKIVCFQTATQDHHLGLSDEAYTSLTSKVTHIIHNAWPMDFKRRLSSFHAPIQSLCNLIQLAKDIHALRPNVVPRLVFTSSIAVTGRYPGRRVAEQRMTDPNWAAAMGYAEAKWVCECLLEDAAQDSRGSFQPAIVRLGQLSGSNHSGFWSKTEHLPTLVSISAKIGALPNIQGSFSWLPMDIAGRAVSDITLSNSQQHFYHVENPIRQPWVDLLTSLRSELRLSLVDFEDWIMQARQSDLLTGLEDFFTNDFETLASGGIILRTDSSRAVSQSLRSCGGVGVNLLKKYLQSWKDQGAL
ncbi:hypothetical protein CNMCM5623_003994 [Aspergillus felis]|uniref:Carrier domain-containing protein n=1 Tax=Aspergillus felis TaxID=1287682 RepID=A0A8H6QGS5_9EURO|nr:hypothetical protein CNMCM5623_003994 [Aspergillus felis]